MITAFVIYKLATRGNGDRTSRYITQLDKARVDGAWNEVPELTKKVKKHTPQCKVLAEVAATEAYIATVEPKQSTDVSTDTLTFETLNENLLSEKEGNDEIVFQGRVCLLWADWLGITSNSALVSSATFARDLQAVKGGDTSTWTKICIVKGAYIEGMKSMQDRRMSDAKAFFTTAVDLIQSNRELISTTPQLAYWSEQLLAQLALSSPDDESITPEATNALRLQVFRHWVYVVSWAKECSATTYRNSPSHLGRSVIWRKYYEHLSLLLRQESNHHRQDNFDERWQLATELRKVESLYENDLLRLHKFPKATESNAIIEEWVEQVIKNWQILCGPGWRDAELGEGGRNAVGHNVLDILYRAATKTFHSTLILRRLFQVHKSLTKFDQAYQCLDTYIELVERAKARAAKSTTPVSGVESTENFLSTISEGIEGLCTFGGQAEARKAHEFCVKVKEWIRKIGVQQAFPGQANGDTTNSHHDNLPRTVISSETLELIFRALGVGTAHWSKWTPFSEERTQLQEDAVSYLTQACSQRPVREVQIETHYATALVLAETRDITGAINHVKKALATTAISLAEESSWVAERRAVSLWHLLALLLSSRHEFDSATKSCRAAFQQLPSSAIFFGSDDKSSHSVVQEKLGALSNMGLVHDMECAELQRMVEIRITELALTELKDGPEDAVNSSNELLSVFSQLFAHLDLDTSSSKLPAPKTPAGTIKSVKGSIFGRKKNRMSALSLVSKGRDAASITTETTRPGTQATQAPTIQVTDETGKTPQHKRHRIRNSLEKKLDGKILGDSPKKLIRKSSQRSTHTAGQAEKLPETPVATNHNASHEAKQLLPEVQHNLSGHDSVPPPASHNDQPPEQDIRLPTLHPLTSATSPPTPRFSKVAAQRHALSLLTKVWLVIATLYRRASMFEDSREACEEAAKAVSKIEDLVGTIDHSARAFAHATWGGTGESVDEIWANVYYERAELLLAIHQRRQLDGLAAPEDDLRKAIEQYEQCLMFFPNHLGGNISLSNLLLDYYERKIDLSRTVEDGKPRKAQQPPSNAALAGTAILPGAGAATTSSSGDSQSLDGIPGSFEISEPLVNGVSRSTQTSARPSVSAVDDPRTKVDDTLKKTPENLTRIAARDRAYGLLSTLTKLGSGWDNSEAWYALARAHELSGEVEKAKSVLWWCIELEDTKPIRHWRNLGYTLD